MALVSAILLVSKSEHFTGLGTYWPHCDDRNTYFAKQNNNKKKKKTESVKSDVRGFKGQKR